MSYSYSPLRYPGGKKSLTEFFADIIKYNKLYNEVYVEPFAGGAGAALNLLFMEYVEKIILNDADYNIYCFWHSILNETESILRRINNVRVTINTWRRQKNVIKRPNEHTPLEIGFATFFLNRCNRSGIINAGPIGGNNQTGKWKIDARFNKKEQCKKIEKIALYRERIKIYNKDAIVFIKNDLKRYDKAIIYFDPPYYVNGKKLYLNYYQHDDHKKLARFIQKHVRHNWILSYDDVPEIKEMYKEKKCINYDLRYSAHISKMGKEVIYFSDQIELPRIYQNIQC